MMSSALERVRGAFQVAEMYVAVFQPWVQPQFGQWPVVMVVGPCISVPPPGHAARRTARTAHTSERTPT